MTVAPRDQISAAVVIPLSSITSGATEGKYESEREVEIVPVTHSSSGSPLRPVWDVQLLSDLVKLQSPKV